MFLILWEFEVKPECEESFETVYGPDGAWVKLFRNDPQYRTTQLLRDPFRSRTYFTLDFWNSQNAYLKFQENNRQAYEALNHSTEYLTLSERHIGSFLQTESCPSSA